VEDLLKKHSSEEDPQLKEVLKSVLLMIFDSDQHGFPEIAS
jgi:hypothetical protein